MQARGVKGKVDEPKVAEARQNPYDSNYDAYPWVDQLGIEFARSGFNYTQLIYAIVTDERYRRVQ